MKKRNVFLVLSVLSLVLSACLDRDQDDYSREKEEKDLARAQAMAGVYRGNLISRRDGSVLAPIEIDVSADTDVIPSNTGGRNVRRVVISAGVTLYRDYGSGENPMPLFFTGGYFDKDSKEFQASMSLSTGLGSDSSSSGGGSGQPGSTVGSGSGSAGGSSGTSSDTIKIKAALEGNTLVGGIEAVAFKKGGADFVLERDGSLPSRTTRSSSVGDFSRPVIYKGKAVYPSDNNFSEDITITITQNAKGTIEDDVKNLFIPLKRVFVSGLIGGDARIALRADSVWDFRSGIVRGTQRVSGTSDLFELRLDCKDRSPGLTGDTLNCELQLPEKEKRVLININRVNP